LNIDFAERARALVGTPFRLQGRSPYGLDCVGLAIETYGLPTGCIRRDYRIRGDHAGEAIDYLSRHFRSTPSTQLRPGDLMLLSVASDQLHFAVRTPDGFVHAHAGLRRVVETPGMPDWPIVASYRRRRR
jgi:murein DD-endopeptidase / murein LD-carboxypeptidase